MCTRPSMPPRSDEGAEVHDGGDGALEAHALGQLREDLGALVAAALLKQHAAGEHDVVAVAVHLDDAGLDLGAQVHVQVLHAAQVHQGGRQEAAQADVQDQAALDHFDDLAGDHFAGLELLLDAVPGALVLSALLGEDETAVLVLLLEDQRLDLVAQSSTMSAGSASLRMDSSREGMTPSLLNPMSTSTSSCSSFDHRAVDEVALVEVGQRAVDHARSAARPRRHRTG